MTKKLTTAILDLSPKKLATFLVLIPMFWVLAYTTSSIIFSALSSKAISNELITNLTFGFLFFCLAVIVGIWLSWFYVTVNAVDKAKLGLPTRWFHIALALLIFYLLYNISYQFLIDNVNEDYRFIFNASSEFIAFAGLLMIYPLLCHYAARAAVVKQRNEPATFIKAIPITLLLFFGSIIATPFIHKLFSSTTSSNSEIITVYFKAFAVFMTVLVIGFLASVTGLI